MNDVRTSIEELLIEEFDVLHEHNNLCRELIGKNYYSDNEIEFSVGTKGETKSSMSRSEFAKKYFAK